MIAKLHRFLSAEGKPTIARLFLRGWVAGLRRNGAGQLDPRWYFYRRRLRVIATSPFLPLLYERLLDVLQEARPGTIRPLTATYGRSAEATILRHDIDLRGCVRNLPALINIERQRDLRSSIFVRVDGEEYHPNELREVVSRLAADGFDVGLHSVAYIAANPEAKFASEVESFTSVFGFGPQVFNFHGLGHDGLAVRMELISKAHSLMRRFTSLRATDCHSNYYAYSLMDCHGAGAVRSLLSDFVSPPLSLAKGKKMVVLTHPTYWGARAT